jgi:hypothetical protein
MRAEVTFIRAYTLLYRVFCIGNRRRALTELADVSLGRPLRLLGVHGVGDLDGAPALVHGRDHLLSGALDAAQEVVEGQPGVRALIDAVHHRDLQFRYDISMHRKMRIEKVKGCQEVVEGQPGISPFVDAVHHRDVRLIMYSS